MKFQKTILSNAIILATLTTLTPVYAMFSDPDSQGYETPAPRMRAGITQFLDPVVRSAEIGNTDPAQDCTSGTNRRVLNDTAKVLIKMGKLVKEDVPTKLDDAATFASFKQTLKKAIDRLQPTELQPFLAAINPVMTKLSGLWTKSAPFPYATEITVRNAPPRQTAERSVATYVPASSRSAASASTSSSVDRPTVPLASDFLNDPNDPRTRAVIARLEPMIAERLAPIMARRQALDTQSAPAPTPGSYAPVLDLTVMPTMQDVARGFSTLYTPDEQRVLNPLFVDASAKEAQSKAQPKDKSARAAADAAWLNFSLKTFGYLSDRPSDKILACVNHMLQTIVVVNNGALDFGDPTVEALFPTLLTLLETKRDTAPDATTASNIGRAISELQDLQAIANRPPVDASYGAAESDAPWSTVSYPTAGASDAPWSTVPYSTAGTLNAPQDDVTFYTTVIAVPLEVQIAQGLEALADVGFTPAEHAAIRPLLRTAIILDNDEGQEAQALDAWVAFSKEVQARLLARPTAAEVLPLYEAVQAQLMARLSPLDPEVAAQLGEPTLDPETLAIAQNILPDMVKTLRKLRRNAEKAGDRATSQAFDQHVQTLKAFAAELNVSV